jgi:hypothetical protein
MATASATSPSAGTGPTTRPSTDRVPRLGQDTPFDRIETFSGGSLALQLSPCGADGDGFGDLVVGTFVVPIDGDIRITGTTSAGATPSRPLVTP